MSRTDISRLRVIIVLINLISWGLVLGLIFVSTPESIGPIGIMLWFGLLILAMTSLQLLIRQRRVFTGLSKLELKKSPDWPGIRLQLIRSLIVSAVIVFILAVRSLRIIDYRDGVLLILTIIVVELIRNLRSGARNIKKID